ncbi:hypothetical protein [Pseudomonas veronii]|uniref:hypothetical protein n=1 Tax=Pseudomonas veronii TaxID=76761 RepID=UPI002D78F991|nr:hypothetical protein [Pseudomonas veronii]WRU66377.1 hypothetical protein VPH48_33995 [Pseudomonas veronii]
MNEYFEIPILRRRYEGSSVAEYVDAKKKARAAGMGAINQEMVDRLLDENKQQETEAAQKTKQARKNAQNSTNNAKQSTPARPTGQPAARSKPALDESLAEMLLEDDVDVFGDVL